MHIPHQPPPRQPDHERDGYLWATLDFCEECGAGATTGILVVQGELADDVNRLDDERLNTYLRERRATQSRRDASAWN